MLLVARIFSFLITISAMHALYPERTAYFDDYGDAIIHALRLCYAAQAH
jgi:hypothetical protein